MDFGLREWLIIIGIIVIGAIAVDGWRRMRGGKRGLRLKPESFTPAARSQQQPAPASSGPVDLNPQAQAAAAARAEPAAAAPAARTSDPLCMPYRATRQSAPEPVAPQPPHAAAPVVQPAQPAASSEPLEVPQQDVLVINVRSRVADGFEGRALLHCILQGGMRFGDMDIFHRHETMTGTGEVLYSMANGVRPGYFDLDNIDDLRTPMVSFFLRLPGPRTPRQAFDLMAACARMVAHELEGEMLDEQRQPVTAQTFERYRLSIQRHEQNRSSL